MEQSQRSSGKATRVQLEDGTEVILNSASKLRFPFRFGNGPREVYLEGEGYFRIAPKGNSVFSIHAGQADIHARNGVCNINAYTPTSVTAQAVSGSMEMEAAGTSIPLGPGEAATAATGRQLTAARMQDQYSITWINGEHFFRDLPAMELKDLIARWFNTTLYIDSGDAEKNY